MLANLLAAVMVLIFGILIKFFKFYNLIAGYNTLPEIQKENVDIEELSNLVGTGLLVMAVVLLLGALLTWLGYSAAFLGSWIVFVIIVIYIAVKAQRFSKK